MDEHCHVFIAFLALIGMFAAVYGVLYGALGLLGSRDRTLKLLALSFAAGSLYLFVVLYELRIF